MMLIIVYRGNGGINMRSVSLMNPHCNTAKSLKCVTFQVSDTAHCSLKCTFFIQMLIKYLSLTLWQQSTDEDSLVILLTLMSSLHLNLCFTYIYFSQGQKRCYNYGAPHLKINCHVDTWCLPLGTLALTLYFSCFCGERWGLWRLGRWAERALAGRQPAASCLPPQAWPACGPPLPAALWPVWWSWSLKGGRGIHTARRESGCVTSEFTKQ